MRIENVVVRGTKFFENHGAKTVTIQTKYAGVLLSDGLNYFNIDVNDRIQLPAESFYLYSDARYGAPVQIIWSF